MLKVGMNCSLEVELRSSYGNEQDVEPKEASNIVFLACLLQQKYRCRAVGVQSHHDMLL